MKEKLIFYLAKRYKKEIFDLYIPDDAFVCNLFPCEYDIPFMISLVLSPDKNKCLGVIIHEES